MSRSDSGSESGPASGSLDTLSGPDTLDAIQRTLDDQWVRHSHVPDVVRMYLAIAAAEVGANIIEHAGRSGAVRIRMDVDVRWNAVRIRFVDDGSPATVDLSAVCLPDEMAERNRGLALAQAVLDELAYRRSGHCNHWTLISRSFE